MNTDLERAQVCLHCGFAVLLLLLDLSILQPRYQDVKPFCFVKDLEASSGNAELLQWKCKALKTMDIVSPVRNVVQTTTLLAQRWNPPH